MKLCPSFVFGATCLLVTQGCGPSAAERQAQEQSKQNKEQAVRLELSSLTSLLDKDLGSAKRKYLTDVEGAAAHQDVDEMVRLMKADLGELIAACDAAAARLDTLEAFLLRNQDYSTALNFDEVKLTIVSKRAVAGLIKTEASDSLKGFRSTKLKISSRDEWQSLGVSVHRGDFLCVVPKGTWEIGAFAGSCTAAGMKEQAVQQYAVDSAHPVGAMLVRSGKAVLGAGELGLAIEGQEGDLEARCNDREYLNNQGSIAVHIVAFSGVPSAFRKK